MVGAAASAFYVNDAVTVLPRAVVAKARTYLAGAYADVLEVIVTYINTTKGFYISGMYLPFLYTFAQCTVSNHNSIKREI